VGRQKITQYTRYLTVVLCVVQAYAMGVTLLHPERLGIGIQIVRMAAPAFIVLTVITMTTATMLLMWLGEQITARGIGNGVSLIITINIISSLPQAVGQRSICLRKWMAYGASRYST
jgi:preprotein translocase subunit SecY